jgi:hypothetical protein
VSRRHRLGRAQLAGLVLCNIALVLVPAVATLTNWLLLT